jgi:hypothetical protein
MLNGILAVLEELREVTGVAEIRAPFNKQAKDRMAQRLQELIDADFDKAVKSRMPELAGSWEDLLAQLAKVEPTAMRGSTPSSETMRARDALEALGYLFYNDGKSPLEFVYAPGRTPAHLQMDELKKTKKMLGANAKAAASPDEKADHKQKIKTVDQEIKALENSDLWLKSAAAEANAKPVSDEPEPLKPTPEMKGLQKQVKAAEQKVAAAATPADKVAAEKELADLESQLSGVTRTAQKAHDSGAPAKKKKGAKADPNDPDVDPDELDPESQALYWRRKRVGAYTDTKDALAAVEKYGTAMGNVLDVTAKDSKQAGMSNDRKTRLANLLKTLRDTVYSADVALGKVGVPKSKAAAEEVENA